MNYSIVVQNPKSSRDELMNQYALVVYCGTIPGERVVG
jgi:hypothetical protein